MGPPSCTVLQDIGSPSCGKDALYQIWVARPEFGKKNSKKSLQDAQNMSPVFSAFCMNSVPHGVLIGGGKFVGG
jgi:hypothetical protein